MLGDQRGEQIRIHSTGILESRDNGVLGFDAEVDGHVAERLAEIDEERGVFTLKRQREGKIRRQSRHAAATLGAEEDK